MTRCKSTTAPISLQRKPWLKLSCTLIDSFPNARISASPCAVFIDWQLVRRLFRSVCCLRSWHRSRWNRQRRRLSLRDLLALRRLFYRAHHGSACRRRPARTGRDTTPPPLADQWHVITTRRPMAAKTRVSPAMVARRYPASNRKRRLLSLTAGLPWQFPSTSSLRVERPPWWSRLRRRKSR